MEPPLLDQRLQPRRSLRVLAADLLQITVSPKSLMHGVEVGELRLPKGASVALLVREGQTLTPEHRTVLLPLSEPSGNAEVLVLRAGRQHRWKFVVRRIMASPPSLTWSIRIHGGGLLRQGGDSPVLR